MFHSVLSSIYLIPVPDPPKPCSIWGTMHWGHAKSKDLIHWEDLPVALAPDESYDADGCFSGSAIVVDDKLYLMYTGHYERNGERRETQCLAVSTNGIDFEKAPNNPVIDDRQLQEYGDITDFRDPKVFLKDGTFYSVVATKNDTNLGRILLFESKDLYEWNFKSVLLEGEKHQGIMWECPDLFHLDGKDVLIMSPIEMERKGYAYYNLNSTAAFIGEMDWETGKFNVENYHEIDTGLDFYAPQTCENEVGDRVMVAWMQMWHRTIWTHELSHGWSGSMTFPRELSVKNNKLVQKPYKTFYDNLTTLIIDKDVSISGDVFYERKSTNKFNQFKLKINTTKADKIFIELFGGIISLKYDVEREILTMKRKNKEFHIVGEEAEELNSRSLIVSPVDGSIEIEGVVDTMSLELFVNGTDTLTTTYYNNEDEYNLEISVKNGSAVVEELEISKLTI